MATGGSLLAGVSPPLAPVSCDFVTDSSEDWRLVLFFFFFCLQHPPSWPLADAVPLPSGLENRRWNGAEEGGPFSKRAFASSQIAVGRWRQQGYLVLCKCGRRGPGRANSDLEIKQQYRIKTRRRGQTWFGASTLVQVWSLLLRGRPASVGPAALRCAALRCVALLCSYLCSALCTLPALRLCYH